MLTPQQAERIGAELVRQAEAAAPLSEGRVPLAGNFGGPAFLALEPPLQVLVEGLALKSVREHWLRKWMWFGLVPFCLMMAVAYDWSEADLLKGELPRIHGAWRELCFLACVFWVISLRSVIALVEIRRIAREIQSAAS